MDDPHHVYIIGFLILASLIAVFLAIFMTWGPGFQNRSMSPYSRSPLRLASDLGYAVRDKVYIFMSNFNDYDNQPIDFSRAAYCRDTGRIFPDCITWTGAIHVDWSFLPKRHKGHYVSWGSLSSQAKQEIMRHHTSLKGFQTEISSPLASPQSIEINYAEAKPGPLYVDPATKILIGWKEVPETPLEVLIVQHPTK